MKKAVSLTLALILVLALAVPSFAADYEKITFALDDVEFALMAKKEKKAVVVQTYVDSDSETGEVVFPDATVLTVQPGSMSEGYTFAHGYYKDEAGRYVEQEAMAYYLEGAVDSWFSGGPMHVAYSAAGEVPVAMYQTFDGEDNIIFIVPDSAAPAATAYARSQSVELDGKAVTLPAYALKDANGYETNYIKLRDLASLLNGTSAQFNVGWDGAVNIETKTAYAPNGTEMTTPFSGDQPYKDNTAAIRVNGAAAALKGIVLTDSAGGGYTYFKLRDVGQALGFNVGWSAERGIYIESGKPYAG